MKDNATINKVLDHPFLSAPIFVAIIFGILKLLRFTNLSEEPVSILASIIALGIWCVFLKVEKNSLPVKSFFSERKNGTK